MTLGGGSSRWITRVRATSVPGEDVSPCGARATRPRCDAARRCPRHPARGFPPRPPRLRLPHRPGPLGRAAPACRSARASSRPPVASMASNASAVIASMAFMACAVLASRTEMASTVWRAFAVWASRLPRVVDSRASMASMDSMASSVLAWTIAALSSARLRVVVNSASGRVPRGRVGAFGPAILAPVAPPPGDLVAGGSAVRGLGFGALGRDGRGGPPDRRYDRGGIRVGRSRRRGISTGDRVGVGVGLGRDRRASPHDGVGVGVSLGCGRGTSPDDGVGVGGWASVAVAPSAATTAPALAPASVAVGVPA